LLDEVVDLYALRVRRDRQRIGCLEGPRDGVPAPATTGVMMLADAGYIGSASSRRQRDPCYGAVTAGRRAAGCTWRAPCSPLRAEPARGSLPVPRDSRWVWRLS
jgi:hypothetical protein